MEPQEQGEQQLQINLNDFYDVIAQLRLPRP